MNKFFSFSLFLLVLSSFVLASAPSVDLNTSASNYGATTATITWNTNISTTNNMMWYGYTPGSNAFTDYDDLNGTTNHQINLTGLEDNTKYYYTLSSCEFGANCTNSTETYFTTERDCANPNNMIGCDLTEGMPSSGSYLGSFLSNLAPGVGVFLLILGIFGAITAIILAVVGILKVKLK